MKYYTGIGSRKTPQETLDWFRVVGTFLANNNYTLRSGGAKGADLYFEKGCDKINGDKEIYLPWHGFENSTSKLIVSDKRAFEIAEKYHPYWHNLKQGGQKLQARNSHQVLGIDLETPSNFIVCYTNGKGGTQQALRIARDKSIPIFNCYEYKDLEEIKIEFKKFLIENTDIIKGK